MASSAHGVLSWRRKRTGSSSSQDHQEESSLTQSQLSSPRISAHRGPTNSNETSRVLSSSVASGSYREPIRSFIHGSVREVVASTDSVQSVRLVRQDTVDLASYLLSEAEDGEEPSFLSPRTKAHPLNVTQPPSSRADNESNSIEDGSRRLASPILEASEPPSPEDAEDFYHTEGPSIIGKWLKFNSPLRDNCHAVPQSSQSHEAHTSGHGERESGSRDRVSDASSHTSEVAPLLPRSGTRDGQPTYCTSMGSERGYDVEGQKKSSRKSFLSSWGPNKGHAVNVVRAFGNVQNWDRKTSWQNLIVNPASCFPAAVTAVLLNILDALSYGMILFPRNSVFERLGSAGISMFYVSTIIAQLTYTTGSVFKGGIGSEMIEVVPFFHGMAWTITEIVGEENPEAVVATTITSYALSSILTGVVFYLMGRFKVGYMVQFIPRHILIGCVGGVGLFLCATGFEVTARMEGSLNYDLDTWHRLTRADTIPLWSVPLVLSICLFCGQRKTSSKYFLPLFVCTIPAVFYFLVLSLDVLDVDNLRNAGWIFQGPPVGQPWWYFWTLYQIKLVHWGAIFQCVPAMFALTFFGILHVPINVPALALQIGEDHVDLDKELKLHGVSNVLSGAVGSVQNYLVFANTVLFIRAGGNSRLAGLLVAFLTFLVMLTGPYVIRFVPVSVVGVLIFDLGFELLLEALWQPRKKLKPLEVCTVVVIVLVMGIYDFVVGIGVGVLLAFISLIVQTSQISPIRSQFSGDAVWSTVRRNPSQQRYLREVGQQIHVLRLSSFLFFGTIVSVEKTIRHLITEEHEKRPIRFLIIDLWQVTGLDYSAGEAFNTISRLLSNKGIDLVLSGIVPQSPLGQSLLAVGFGESTDVLMLPDLNSALESCENELLKTFYVGQEAARQGAYHSRSAASTACVDVPGSHDRLVQSAGDGAQDEWPYPLEALASSPRRSHLQLAASRSLSQTEVARLTRWQGFREPLRLLLQIFHGLSPKNEDFWFRAIRYFVRREYPAGFVLFSRGDVANGFYLIEKGILRAEYDLAQGRFFEAIVAGTTCGELPFFSDTPRTANVVVERDCVLWLMDRENWQKMHKEEPEVMVELLKMSLNLTSERMSCITSYTLTIAT